VNICAAGRNVYGRGLIETISRADGDPAGGGSRPQLGTGHFGALGKHFELCLRELGMDPASEAAISAGNYIFAAHDAGILHEPIGD
jgi:hypothetical protein